jgi:hypothetical protein
VTGYDGGMSKLASRSPHSPLVVLLLPFSVALAQACHGSSSETGASEGDVSGDVCEECDTGEVSVSSASAGGAGGAFTMPPPANVCPMGSLSSFDLCTPTDPSCNVSSLCMAPIDQSSATVFGLRMAQLDVSLPTSFSTIAVQPSVASAILPDDAACNLEGNGTFSWLLQFDPAAGTLVTGGARPVADPTLGYSFDDETIASGSASFHVASVTLSAEETPECAFSSSAADLVMPVFLDAMGVNVMLLPLHQLGFDSGRISADNGCIGQYNAAGLAEASECQPTGTIPSFIDGASVSAFFVLEEADTVEVAQLGQSLCVLLSGDAQGFGDGGSPIERCKRDASGEILFKGDWCAATNAKATPGCEDSLRFTAQFAAQGATIQ